ncbi:hypothetical protein HO173_008948 [Letharia columbiana]|uniref:Uncharacterized protein n=1 Tax=Letharia columbiana TaxID=112416 RepID=A0A8H6L276_9LECA|nr:uncharacterized protein HO173_008948 [Letharia columbiana]KAF6232734.1 hypothetical protein HO173_008948 [Letharia columbiana]
MLLSRLISAQLSLFFAQYVLAAAPAQTLTDDGNGKQIYVPQPGTTSSVASPEYTPTLVYNCAQMPLICENVAAWAKTNNNAGGDIPANNLFLYFDPDATNKNARRQLACGCFDHDGCDGSGTSGTSKGKRTGDKVTDIATSAGPFANIPPTAAAIIMAGPNPPSGGNRQPLNSIPGRFFAFGIGMTCDEFPAAPFIEGGANAETICALQSWQVYQGKATSQNNQGKWPLTPQEGKRSEQDWQAQAHVYLRQAFGIQNRRNPIGLGTVWPFSFTTTTDSVATSSKAWVIVSGPATSVVTKRDLPPVTIAVPTATNLAVTGDEKIDARALHDFGPRAPEPDPNSPTGVRLAVRTASPIQKRRNTGFLMVRANVSSTPAADCTIDFDTQGLEDTDVGDPGFDDLLPQYQSKPICEGGNSEVSDVQAADTWLDSQGNDWDYGNCCGGGIGDGSCGPILVQNGTASVSLCGDTNQCVGCAQLGNYVEGIIGACQQDGLVNGVQVLNEVEGLNISVSLVDGS